MHSIAELESLIRDVPDFPKTGVIFKDITTMLAHPGALADCVSHLENELGEIDYDAVACIESRGFVFGAVLAARHDLPLVLVRKPGKLPAETMSEDYELEYGTNTVEIHRHCLPGGCSVLLVDDLVATGGSMLAAARLLERDGHSVAAAAYVINLEFLGGRKRIEEQGYTARYLIEVE